MSTVTVEFAAAAAQNPPDALLLGFARALRAAGVPVTADREASFLEAVSLVGLGDETRTYWAGRATLCSGPDHHERYDQVFTAWFHGRTGSRTGLTQTSPVPMASLGDTEDDEAEAGQTPAERVNALASRTEVLRQRDVGSMSSSEKQALAVLFGSLRRPAPVRRTARRTPWHRGEIDQQHTLRQQLRRWGEPAPLQWRRRGRRARRVVMLVDVSGSMAPYADALLRLGHRWASGSSGRERRHRTPRDVHVFTMGTRLTPLTRALRQPDPELAIVAAGNAVPDWSGGTRLGESLKAFLDQWGRRGLARGAVVVIFSDGWERGGAELLAEQMRRLRSVAHRVVWVNPHKGKDGYQPVQQGIAAALPHCDAFVAGHSLATFEELAEVVEHA